MKKPKISRTYGPIHFEDLDPHRFEDLIRELIYDFKPWQSIEATGRSGSDDGFDIRAFEKTYIEGQAGEDDSDVQISHPMKGNQWMIQCKREGVIGPKKIETIIIDGVNEESPPYGYILVASANFSKVSYDTFRTELMKKNVQEFYLWGKAELEDFLHFPKYDRILFTYFGISLVSQRKSRSTEIRSAVVNKNKIFQILGFELSERKEIPVRDINDHNYPYREKYNDFNQRPRWMQYEVDEYHVLGIFCHMYEYYAYIDTIRKEWDYTEALDLTLREPTIDAEAMSYRKLFNDKKKPIKQFWDNLPHINKAKYNVWGLLKFADLQVIDEQGDHLFPMPHVYVDFQSSYAPFSKNVSLLKKSDNDSGTPIDGYKRISIFPETFPAIPLGKVVQDREIILDVGSTEAFTKGNDEFQVLYSCDDKYDFLAIGDMIALKGSDKGYGKAYFKITYKYQSSFEMLKHTNPKDHFLKQTVEKQIERQIEDHEVLKVVELKRTYDHQVD